ncbi:conserved Plasmodium protein, unknown function [Plasmodium berghei]|uniref:Phosphatidate cytidylyltransferase n=2 Tax=Plasmodium berghei TaxID=5821 RepID=A0A509AUD1_PLABA|nr:conserved protein, unknown function [Plasmodium berghei ANKA]CXI77550.1 conserved Plasmodium protein, unknown function [Plasmodium berghei]SCM25064.1 conserved Plasmodium protein, unknown function [Plasmodium berghei]SCN27251.1 conserved Plasmodium protein, unknown function [Plasmodium berghei]SCO61843.1 conserved Plasmodium protein, unknown function [Plasmodium berghei]SCO63677.1 conserved Plasmodium protein, unknown function [Plasmodium berghei]|eukprot:XP_034422887.1 conserved protein, unknown function [Plasmodium berghei ANKA]
MYPIILFLAIVIVVTILDVCSQIPKFYARKLTHMLCGIFILMFDIIINGTRKNESQILGKSGTTDNEYGVYFIYIVAITSILRCFFYPFRFGEYLDKGIIVYNTIVALFFFFKLPLYVLTPIFFADPIAAIVGQYFSKRKIYKNKTLHGTLACFFVSLMSLFYVKNYIHALILSTSLCLLELYGGTLDNFFMCFPIIIYMVFFNV